MTKTCPIVLSLLASCLVGAPAPGAAPAPGDRAADQAGVEFFETKIRPVLVEQCYKCHSAASEKLKGKLLVDSRAGLLEGGESGEPAVAPGDVGKSKLIAAIRYKDEDLQMPPKGQKLPAGVIADFEAWVRAGAPDPRDGGAAQVAAAGPSHLDIGAAKKKWAFQPPRPQPEPRGTNAVLSAWVKTPVDAFVAARLQEKGLSPSPAAEKRALIRRVTFDLTGLPPTPQEVEAFVNDPSPNAYPALVDRLLASPRYGERWGRYWLDVARYADTKGYVFEEERRYPFSYTYRDWVIRAFNEDLPYDQFLVEQIAADQLALKDDKRPLAAMGFLTLGRRFLNQQPDIIDDRIDVLMRGTQGLTVACARCHDHKYDPIPTQDYYSLYGVFASSEEPKSLPVIETGEKSPEGADYEKQSHALEEQLAALKVSKLAEHVAALRQAKEVADYLLAAQELSKLPEGQLGGAIQAAAQKWAPSSLTPQGVGFVLRRWQQALRTSRDPAAPAGALFAPWHALAAVPEKEFAARAPAVAAKLAADPRTPKALAAALAKPPASLRDVAERYGQAIASAYPAGGKPAGDAAALRQALDSAAMPYDVPLAEATPLYNRADEGKFREVRKKADALMATHPGSTPRAMVMGDLPAPVTPHVFLRGNPNAAGPEVPRQFLAVLSPDARQPFKRGSGRLELAQAIASKDNPLTARVMVNRVWMHHFGYGLVRTPSDFGNRGDAPSHPELLDYLARRFMDEGWSVKKLHRLIVTSAAYQQASDDSSYDNARARAVDPENRLLWRMNRRRLDFESLRDSLLAAAGQLDPKPFGRAVDLFAAPFSRRRTVYGFIDRQNLPGLFRTFDFASPDSTSPQRFSTTVPQQALFLMNSPFTIEQARALLKRPEIADEADASKRVDAMYRVLYGRPAAGDEIKLAQEFLAAESPAASLSPVGPVWQFGYGEYDPAARSVKSFTPLPHFTGSAWQGGAKLPDPKTGFVLLNAQGGHPGPDPKHAAVRRWTAPRDGAFAVAGKLEHPGQAGDGVQARVVAGGKEWGAWVAEHSKLETRVARVELKRGQMIDFVVDCRTGDNTDGFAWPVTVSLLAAAAAPPGPDADTRGAWESAADFAGAKAVAPKGPPMSAWEKYAQVLLESNEFVFVD